MSQNALHNQLISMIAVKAVLTLCCTEVLWVHRGIENSIPQSVTVPVKGCNRRSTLNHHYIGIIAAFQVLIINASPLFSDKDDGEDEK